MRCRSRTLNLQITQFSKVKILKSLTKIYVFLLIILRKTKRENIVD